MELIPIIKYALSMISAIAFVVVVVSYIIYKVRNGDKKPGMDTEKQVINTFEHSSVPSFPQNVALPQAQPAYNAPAAYAHQRNFNHNHVTVKKQAPRFMVLNTPAKEEQSAPLYKQTSQNEIRREKSVYNTQSNFNIYNNYSANYSEPLQKFGI